MAKNSKKFRLDKQNLSLLVAVLAFAVAGVALLRASSAAPLNNATCTITGNTYAAPMSVTGTGYAANTTYRLLLTWPAGNGEAATTTVTNSSGDINYPGLYAEWHGTYIVQVQAINAKTKVLATCSTTVQ